MKKKIAIITILLIIFISLLVSLNQTEKKDELYTKKDFLMDTTVEIKVISEKNANNGNKVISETLEIMREWDRKLNRYNENSLISKINNKGNKGVKVSDEIINFFKELKRYGKLTEGNFDPTIAPLIDLWGFGKENTRIPAENDIKSLLKLVDYNDIKIDEKKNIIYLPKKSKIDLGSAAKGFIIDKAYKNLKKNNIENFFINAGGNIRVSGMNIVENRLWSIGIRKPRANNQVYKDYILEISKGAVSTSGDYERYFIKDNKRYSHLIDPKTGYPARDLQSVTVYTSTALRADVLSTALFIMGWNKAKEKIKNSEDIAGFLIKDGEIWYSEDFEGKFSNN